MVYDQFARPGQGEGGPVVPAEILAVWFPLALGGYDRGAVEAYLRSVNRVIAKLTVSRSPQSAVRHALERVGEQTSGVLQRTRETAAEITASARAEAEEFTARAKAEAAELVVNTTTKADRTKAEAEEFHAKARAEAKQILADARADAETILVRARAQAGEQLQRSEQEIAALREQAEARESELQAGTAAVWEGRRELLDDIGAMATRLEALARDAATRFAPRQPAEPAEEEMLERETEAHPEPLEVAADEPTRSMPAARRDGEPADQEPSRVNRSPAAAGSV